MVLLAGEALDVPTSDGLGLFCKFGEFIVRASNLTCVAPVDIEAAAGLTLDGSCLQLHGSARRDGCEALVARSFPEDSLKTPLQIPPCRFPRPPPPP